MRVARGGVDHDHDHVVVRHARPRHDERLADDDGAEAVRDGLFCVGICSRQQIPDVARPLQTNRVDEAVAPARQPRVYDGKLAEVARRRAVEPRRADVRVAF